MNKSVSPSRTYVAVCCMINFDGYYFRKFKLPETVPPGYGELVDQPLENTSGVAESYFLNRLNFEACIEGCVAYEDFLKLEDQDELNAETRKRGEEYSRRLEEAKKLCPEGCTHRVAGCKMNEVSF